MQRRTLAKVTPLKKYWVVAKGQR